MISVRWSYRAVLNDELSAHRTIADTSAHTNRNSAESVAAGSEQPPTRSLRSCAQSLCSSLRPFWILTMMAYKMYRHIMCMCILHMCAWYSYLCIAPIIISHLSESRTVYGLHMCQVCGNSAHALETENRAVSGNQNIFCSACIFTCGDKVIDVLLADITQRSLNRHFKVRTDFWWSIELVFSPSSWWRQKITDAIILSICVCLCVNVCEQKCVVIAWVAFSRMISSMGTPWKCSHIQW